MSDGENELGTWDAFVAERDAAAQARITERLKAPTYQDEVRSNLRTALADFRYVIEYDGTGAIRGKLTKDQQGALLGYLLPVVLELVDHAVQIGRIERGVLPMDEG